MCDICSTMPQQGSYYRRKRVLSALFKDRWNVKSLLKEGAHFSGKEQKVLFWEKFQKKVNETIRSKKKKNFFEGIYQPTPTNRPYHYGSHQLFFPQVPHTSSLVWTHLSYQNQGFMPGDGQRKFYSRGGRGKLESQSLCDIRHKSETKNTRPFKFKQLLKRSLICKTTFQGDQINFSSGRMVKSIFWKTGKKKLQTIQQS